MQLGVGSGGLGAPGGVGGVGDVGGELSPDVILDRDRPSVVRVVIEVEIRCSPRFDNHSQSIESRSQCHACIVIRGMTWMPCWPRYKAQFLLEDGVAPLVRGIAKRDRLAGCRSLHLRR